jgi:prepilin-type N-terminal cleavage/methylation domain-containing protein/prepilin-type processing-associated H-X9-DG protein
MKPTIKNQKGFTLIELLIVIAIIAILASILMPVLAAAQKRAQLINCLNNLRQWGVGLHVYAADSADEIPRDGTDKAESYIDYAPTSPTDAPMGTPMDPGSWFNALPPNVGEQPLSSYYNSGSPPTLRAAGVAKKILPFPGNGIGRIWHCPQITVSPSDTFLMGGQYGFFSYEMNIDLKAMTYIHSGYSSMYPGMPKIANIHNSSATVMLTEAVFSPTGEATTPEGQSVGTPSQNGTFPASRWNYFAWRHLDHMANLMFIDGHAATFKHSYVFNSNPTPDSRDEKDNYDIIWDQYRK